MHYEKLILIDPSSPVYGMDKLFLDDFLNRDDCLLPIRNLYADAKNAGIGMHTADMFLEGKVSGNKIDYYSLGILDNFKKLSGFNKVTLQAFFILEPPVVQNILYKNIDALSRYFNCIYVHNTQSIGYKALSAEKLKKLFWMMPHHHVIEKYWNNTQRQKRVVIINTNLRPKTRFKTELYSVRIAAMAQLAKDNMIDLYGRGWNRWHSRSALWLPYWKNFSSIKKIYHGACDSKFEVLSRYDFCLCFENMIMPGYMTEKMFDCFYAGTIPIYLGAPDVLDYIPKEAFIDARQFASWREITTFIKSLSDEKIRQMKMAGKDFVHGEKFDPFYYSLKNTVII